MQLKKIAIALALAGSTIAAGSANAAVIDLGFVLDRSGSVGSGNWTSVTSGLANALAVIPTAGPNQYRIAVSSFATTASVDVLPVILTAGNLAGIQASINAIAFTNGNTCIQCGTTALTNAYIADGGLSSSSLMNISTDGVPNIGETNGTTLRNSLTASGWDSISAEAIGNFNLSFLQALVSPNPGVTTNDPNALPNPLVQGFVLTVANFDDYGPAIAAKVQNIVDLPEPGSVALLGVALAGIAGLRRKQAS
ncbi:VWA domain-containing protein [Accumulibacter sp.]|uniref:VWA domain-containing protein n=1 Tax=Accumulibacter sp. TaxID=2053492 RepID=UPI0025E1974B|nr:VWA domain-containing protein [Accumulibacter sp.]MCM8611496.1 VWA domain-containing protein [Accumulibacter sp.]MCM8635130.1 VWA domain-containing protein [Accumulibacter sp.]MCM8641053.1 VWA domain-containing protein [Accumulibacter sp.]